MGNEECVKIERKDIPNDFECFKEHGKFRLTYGKAKPIYVKFPLNLNSDVAKIAAMIMDGCLDKNHRSVMFSQKKDLDKVREFAEICRKNFNVSGRIHNIRGCLMLTYSSKTLSKFFYSCLSIHKSDESARIPKWIWNSPLSVIITYLRYAFAMEGSVSDYRKGNEVKFHSCDLPYIEDLKKLLTIKFKIDSKIYTYYIKNYGYKYYLYFSDKENIAKFLRIGFALKSHQKRLLEVVKNFKSKAWEITLVTILDIPTEFFKIKDINNIFSYLCKRAVHDRLTSLIEIGYLSFSREKGYHLTVKGYKKALSLRDSVRITKLRTNPKNNENQVFSFLKKKKTSYRNEIARNLNINTATTREVLNRLLGKDKIQITVVDRFQRKFYSIKK
jgi:Mn-dependent DtxR family transcriptional regulator